MEVLPVTDGSTLVTFAIRLPSTYTVPEVGSLVCVCVCVCDALVQSLVLFFS